MAAIVGGAADDDNGESKTTADHGTEMETEMERVVSKLPRIVGRSVRSKHRSLADPLPAGTSLRDLSRLAGLATQRRLAEGGEGTSAPEARAAARREVFEQFVDAGLTVRPLLFFSGSKDVDDLEMGVPRWRKICSNFEPVPHPKSIEANGRRQYRTVEHAFQAAKFLGHASPRDKSVLRAADFEVGGRLGRDPKKAKLAGGRRGMGALGLVLNRESWAGAADGVMAAALAARWTVDLPFREVLWETGRQGILLVHFERSGSKSYWGGGIRADGATAAGVDGQGAAAGQEKDGGNGERQKQQQQKQVMVGGNRLGEMLMDLRDRGDTDGKRTLKIKKLQ